MTSMPSKGAAWWDITPQEIREMIFQRSMTTETKIIPIGHVEDVLVQRDTRTTPVRLYRPAEPTKENS